MNPWMTQATAAAQSKDMLHQAAAARMAREVRRSRPARQSHPMGQVASIIRIAIPRWRAARYFRSCLAITRRWIWFVPS
jgi:hypothetical protein